MSRSLRLGIFIVFTLAAAGTAVFLIGSNSFLFTHTYRLFANFSDVAGLQTGAPVQVAGVQQGSVRRIFLPPHPGLPVRVEMKLKDDTRRVVKKDSLATISTEGLVGDQVVALSMGSSQSPPVQNGDTIQGRTPAQFSELMTRAQIVLDNLNGVLAPAKGAMGNIADITGKLDRGEGSLGALLNDPTAYRNFNQATGNLAEITGKLNRGEGSLGALLKDPTAYRHFNLAAGNLADITGKLNRGEGSLGALLNDPSAYRNFNQAAGNLAEITGKLNNGGGSLGALLNDPSAYQHLNQATNNLAEITGKINGGQGTLGQLINDPSMYEHLNGSAENIQDDTEALKHNFLLRGFFKHRGYENQSDLGRYAIPHVPAGRPAHRIDIPGAAVFKDNKRADVEHEKSLQAAGEYLQSHPFAMAVVSAQSGMDGNTTTEQHLTDARAYSVRQWLVDHYPLDDTRIKTIGLGKSRDVPPGGELSIRIYNSTSQSADRAK